MPHAILLQFSKKLAQTVLCKVVHPTPAVSGDHVQFFWISLHDLRHKLAALFFQITQDTDLMFKSLFGHMTSESLVHTTIITESDKSTGCIFCFLHTTLTKPPLTR